MWEIIICENCMIDYENKKIYTNCGYFWKQIKEIYIKVGNIKECNILDSNFIALADKVLEKNKEKIITIEIKEKDIEIGFNFNIKPEFAGIKAPIN